MDLELFLVDSSNEFQQLLREEAEAAARRAGLTLQARFTGDDFSAQLTQLRAGVVRAPKAILVMAVRDRGLARVAAEAARAGIHWIFLNRSEDDLDELRRQSPGVALSVVCPDEVETGRTQGRLFRILHRPGGKLLYVQGSRRSLAARDRTAGVEEALAGSGIELLPLEAGWKADESRTAVRDFLSVASRAGVRLGLVGGQNDLIASGAADAMRAVASDLKQPELASVPVVGCDGTPGFGQRLVREGRLKATVVLPLWTRLAVEAIAGTLRSGQLPPPFVSAKPTTFPAEQELRRPPA
jgi:ABC-type sugar transport system substrate-binding protein